MINFYLIHNKSSKLDKSYLEPEITKLYVDGIDVGYNYSRVLHMIKKHPMYAYHYALDIIKGRWVEAEPFILKSGAYAYLYEIQVLRYD